MKCLEVQCAIHCATEPRPNGRVGGAYVRWTIVVGNKKYRLEISSTNDSIVRRRWGTAGSWTQDLLFTRQALWPTKPQRLHHKVFCLYLDSKTRRTRSSALPSTGLRQVRNCDCGPPLFAIDCARVGMCVQNFMKMWKMGGRGISAPPRECACTVLLPACLGCPRSFVHRNAILLLGKSQPAVPGWARTTILSVNSRAR